jgi:hypothetical protein
MDMLRQSVKAVTPPILWLGVSKLFKKEEPLPELFDGDNALYKTLLQSSKVYGEYGCGASTKWVLQNTNANVLSVDTSKYWIESTKESLDELTLSRASIQHVDLGELGNWGRPVGYTVRNKFIHYTNSIWEGDNKPDTVLIDGRFRVCSFLTSLKFANQGTKILFDDYTERRHFHIVESFLPREDTCGRQCLFIIPKSSDIDYARLDNEIHNFRHVME